MANHDMGVVAITGASSGIGRETAMRFAREGWRVGLIARSQDELEAVGAEIERMGGRAVVAPADVSDADALDAAAARIEETLGPITVWVNDAGTSIYSKFGDISDEEYRRVTEVTYLGVVNGTRAALKRMKPRNRGTIVQVGSLIAYRGAPLQTPYTGAKYAVRGFSEALRSELMNESSKVWVTVVHPPSVNTPFFSHAADHMDAAPRPIPPVYQPEIIADAIHFAATHRRREMRVTGTTLGFALLNVFAPRFADWLTATTGVAAQKTQKASVRTRRDVTLYRPMSKRASTHGPFESEARGFSVQHALNKNPGLVLLGMVGLAIGAAMAVAGPRYRPARRGGLGQQALRDARRQVRHGQRRLAKHAETARGAAREAIGRLT